MSRSRPVLVVVAGAAVVVGLALFGAHLAPHDPTETLAAPWQPPGPGLLLGADGLGRDIASRLAAGGQQLAAVGMLAAIAASAVGVAGGLYVGWVGRGTRTLTAAADLLLALPMLLIAMVLVVALPGPAAVVVGTVCGGSPLTLRVVADATRQAGHAGYVEAALARGERTSSVLVREVLPALSGLVAADVGLRCVLALQLASALSLLGFGPAPPTPDWAAMLRENLPGVAANPAALAAPAAAIAVLTLAVTAFAYAVATRSRAS